MSEWCYVRGGFRKRDRNVWSFWLALYGTRVTHRRSLYPILSAETFCIVARRQSLPKRPGSTAHHLAPSLRRPGEMHLAALPQPCGLWEPRTDHNISTREEEKKKKRGKKKRKNGQGGRPNIFCRIVGDPPPVETFFQSISPICDWK